MGDLMKLFRLGTGGEGGLCGVAIMAYHGDLGGMGGKKAMVDGVRRSSSILLFLPIPYRFLFCRCCYLFDFWVFLYLLGEGSKEHKKYSKFDTKHYTREAKFCVFWH